MKFLGSDINIVISLIILVTLYIDKASIVSFSCRMMDRMSSRLGCAEGIGTEGLFRRNDR